MKHIRHFLALAAIIAATLSAPAASPLLIETIITQHDPSGTSKVLSRSRAFIESGKRASLRGDTFVYTVTATLNRDHTVQVNGVLTEHKDGKAKKLAAPSIKARLNEAAEIQQGPLAFKTTVSLVK